VVQHGQGVEYIEWTEDVERLEAGEQEHAIVNGVFALDFE
jgi:hypothetical protein